MNIFWNRSESRLRAFWRLLLQSILMFFFSSVVSLIAVGILLSMPGGMDTLFEKADVYNALYNFFTVNPIVSLVIILASFLAVIFSIMLAARLFDKRPLASFGLHLSRKWWLDFAFGLGLGAVLIVLIFLIEWAAGWVMILPQKEDMIKTLPLVMIFGLVRFFLIGVQEEMFSRGYHLINLSEGFSSPSIGRRNAVWLAYLSSSVIFGLMHLGNPNMSVFSTINLCLAGFFLGLAFILTGELALSIGIHITWNFFQGCVCGFPVSGLPSSGSLILIQQGGPSFWTGGLFGPEGGLLSVFMMLLGAGLIILWVRRTRGKVALDDRIGVYTRRASQVISKDTALV